MLDDSIGLDSLGKQPWMGTPGLHQFVTVIITRRKMAICDCKIYILTVKFLCTRGIFFCAAYSNVVVLEYSLETGESLTILWESSHRSSAVSSDWLRFRGHSRSSAARQLQLKQSIPIPWGTSSAKDAFASTPWDAAACLPSSLF